MQLLGLKSCDTCRKAIRDLEEAGFEVAFVDVREAPLGVDQLAELHAAFGDALINRRSTTWRGLTEDERRKDPVALILAHPALMKRPVVIDGARTTLGWDAGTRARYLD